MKRNDLDPLKRRCFINDVFFCCSMNEILLEMKF